MKKLIYLALILVAAITYFMQDNYRSVNDIAPEVLKPPIQTKVSDAAPETFERDGFEYTVTPLYDYELNGLVVSRYNYQWFALSRTDKVYPFDICAIWGSNVESKVYQDKGTSFSQDGRWCNWSWSGSNSVDQAAVANNHLLVKDDQVYNQVKRIHRGDQVKIKGRLVNVAAQNLGSRANFEFDDVNWQTSTRRDDTGAGACEIIEVASVEILKAVNPIPRLLFQLCLAALAFMLLMGIIGLFRPPKTP